MVYGIMASKKHIKLFLRRHILKSKERERPRTLQDCLIKPKRHRSNRAWILLFILLVMCYASTLLWSSQDDLDVNSTELPNRLPAGHEGNEIDDTRDRYKGKQIVPPSPVNERQRANTTMWQSYWAFKEKMYLFLNIKKKIQGNVKENSYAHSIKLTSQTTTTTKQPNGTPCTNIENNDKNSNVSLKLSNINEDLEKIYPMVKMGGFYKPSDCWSRHKVAIIVPYRDRLENLKVFLYNIHPFLIAQKLEYQIFVIEQYAAHKFNRGRLCNAGFLESKKWGPWHCVIFHDVDLLPLSSKILYNCPMFPRFMSSTVLYTNGTDKKIEVFNRFGAVSAVTTQHYEKVNGHSNIFWHYGTEEQDIFIRFVYARIPLVKNKKDVSIYVELPHRKERILSNIRTSVLLHNAGERSEFEGLSTLEYVVRKLILHHLYTHIVVDIDPYALDRTMQPPTNNSTRQ